MELNMMNGILLKALVSEWKIMFWLFPLDFFLKVWTFLLESNTGISNSI